MEKNAIINHFLFPCIFFSFGGISLLFAQQTADSLKDKKVEHIFPYLLFWDKVYEIEFKYSYTKIYKELCETSVSFVKIKWNKCESIESITFSDNLPDTLKKNIQLAMMEVETPWKEILRRHSLSKEDNIFIFPVVFTLLANCPKGENFSFSTILRQLQAAFLWQDEETDGAMKCMLLNPLFFYIRWKEEWLHVTFYKLQKIKEQVKDSE